MSVKERPILFSAPMVRALLDGRKTQTRRVVKPQPTLPVATALDAWHWVCKKLHAGYCHTGRHALERLMQPHCPYGQPGERLWVREAWQHAMQDKCSCPQPSEPSPCDDWMNGTGCRSNRGEVIYRADIADLREERAVTALAKQHGTRVTPWRPSIHMPRWASRITLEITGVRAERLQEISQEDAMAEGAPPSHPSIDAVSREFGYADFSRSWYAQLWEQINGAGSWEANPWVWVVEFKRLSHG